MRAVVYKEPHQVEVEEVDDARIEDPTDVVIKVTTAAILILLVRAHLQGRDHIVVAGRRIDEQTVISAVVVTTAALCIVFLASAFLLSTQPLSPQITPSSLIYEVVSAFATVGLSLGVTPHLNEVGQLTIILLMFVGRVGPLTLLVVMQTKRRSAIDYPSARVMIG